MRIHFREYLSGGTRNRMLLPVALYLCVVGLGQNGLSYGWEMLCLACLCSVDRSRWAGFAAMVRAYRLGILLLGTTVILQFISGFLNAVPFPISLQAVSKQAEYAVALLLGFMAIEESGEVKTLDNALLAGCWAITAFAIVKMLQHQPDAARGSTFHNGHATAQYLVLAIPVGIASFLVSRGKTRPAILLSACGIALGFFALILTLARACWIGLLVGLAVAIGGVPREYRGKLGKTLCALLLMALCLFPFHIRKRIPAKIEKYDSSYSSIYERQTLWKKSIEMIRDHPLLGIGPGNFRYVYRADMPPEAREGSLHAHNLYLQILAETGVLGFLAFFGALACIAFRGFKNRRSLAPEEKCLLCGIYAALGSLLVAGLSDYVLYHRHVASVFFCLLGSLVSVTWRSGKQP